MNLRGVFIPNKYEKTAKSHFCRFSLISIRMEVNAARIKKGVPRKINRAPENRSEARFLGRGAAGATGKAASIARRRPWRLDATSRRGEKPLQSCRKAANNRFPPFSRLFLSSARKKKCEQNHSKKAKPRFCLFHLTARSCTGKGEFARRL